MDRPEPGLVKWSPNAQVDSFVHVNLQHRVVQLYEPTGHARNSRFDYAKTGKHDDFPHLTTYDWSPCNPGLLAVGTATGTINLLKIDDGSNAYLELGLKMARTCHAVAFNTTGLLAVGLDRVRMDSSLQVWDLERLSSTDIATRGFPSDALNMVESNYKLESSVSISSIKFFEDNPQTLVAGIKSQGLRIHDLRSPTNAITFQTKCINNIAIDYADQNYFASSTLDHPGVLIWDRRATSRAIASHTYSQALDQEDVPWGGALRLDRAVEADIDPNSTESRHSLIRSLRYCRDQRGLLAVLSRTGQLRVLETNKEVPSSDMALQEGPELLRVETSREMDVTYRYSSHKNDKIVSFDWATVGTPGLRPRLLVLRTNGSFGILEQPSRVADQIYKLVPWQAPHRGLEAGLPYESLMQFDETEAADILKPILSEQALSSLPVYGPDKPKLAANVRKELMSRSMQSLDIEYQDEISPNLPGAFYTAKTVSDKLKAIRTYIKEESKADESTMDGKNAKSLRSGGADLSLAANNLDSCREFHEALLGTLISEGLPREAQSIVDHTMLLRAKEKYLFDAVVNRDIVADDPWKRYLWDWIADAESAAEDDALVFAGVDMSYLGIHSIWTNNLGRTPRARLDHGVSAPDTPQLERNIAAYCKKRHLPRFDAVSTRRPYTRQMCLEICGWGDPERHDPNGIDRQSESTFPTAVHTMSACRALFKGDTGRAIEILKTASAAHPELLFVSLALQLVGKGGSQLAKKQLDFDVTVASKTDPYLRAISSLIATGDWKTIANQRSLPLADRVYAAVRNFSDDELTSWLNEQVSYAVQDGDVEGIVLAGITDTMVDIFARYVQKFHDYQTATLVLSICYPRYIDDIRCAAWRNAYRAHLQRHKLFFQRTKFEVESTKRSKRDGVPTLKPPSRQIALRCLFCDAETTHRVGSGSGSASAPGSAGPGTPRPVSSAMEIRNPLLATSINAGVSCPNCGRHLPRCVTCLEVVGVPRSDRPEDKEESKMAGRFPTFCLRCEHVLHLDHARQWFARHSECPVPECRCRCNFRANPELNYR